MGLGEQGLGFRAWDAACSNSGRSGKPVAKGLGIVGFSVGVGLEGFVT